MSYSTTKVFKMKRQILEFCEKISKGESRPDQKFVADICYGALASQNCLHSSISHCLHEKTPKRRTVERLARHLNRDVSYKQQKNYLDMIVKRLPSEPVIHVDNSDVTKPYGRCFEDLCMVRDGSKSTAKNGSGKGLFCYGSCRSNKIQASCQCLLKDLVFCLKGFYIRKLLYRRCH